MRHTAQATGLLVLGTVLLSGCGHHASTPAPVPSATPTTAASSSPSSPDWNHVNLGTAAPNQVPVGRTGVPRGGVQRPNLSDPNSVARAVAITQATWDARLDESPQDAARRAAGWMVPTLAQRTRTARTAGGDAWWSQLATAKGWTTATATEWAPISGTGNQRQVTLLLAITAHGVTLPDQHQLLILTLTSSPAPVATPTPSTTPAPSASTPPASAASPSPSWLVSQITYLPAS